MALFVNAQIPSDIDTLRLESGSGNPGDEVSIAVHLVNTFAVGGFSTRIVFDEGILSIQSLELADRTSDMNIFAVDSSDAGVLQVSGAYLQPRDNYLMPGSGEIYYVNLLINDYAEPGIYPLEFQNSGFHTYENHLSDTTGLIMVIPVVSDAEMEVEEIVSVDENASMPASFSVLYNYPNPFNNRTSFHLNLKDSGKVKVCIFNMLGQKIRTLGMGVLSPGEYRLVWDGRDNFNKEVSSGVYGYALYVNNMSVITNKMILLK